MSGDHQLIEIRDRLKNQIPDEFHHDLHQIINKFIKLMPFVDPLGKKMVISPLLILIKKLEKQEVTPPVAMAQLQKIFDWVKEVDSGLLEDRSRERRSFRE